MSMDKETEVPNQMPKYLYAVTCSRIAPLQVVILRAGGGVVPLW